MFYFQALLEQLKEETGHGLSVDYESIAEASHSTGLELKLPLDDMRQLGYTLLDSTLVTCKVLEYFRVHFSCNC